MKKGLIYGVLGFAGGYLAAHFLQPAASSSVKDVVSSKIGTNRWECTCADGRTVYCNQPNCACCGGGAGYPIAVHSAYPNVISIPSNLRKTVGTL